MTLENETLLNVLAGVTADMSDSEKTAFRVQLRRVLPPVIASAGVTAKLQAAAVRPKMTLEEADKIVDSAIKLISERDGLSYDRALKRLSEEKPALIAGWQAIRNRAMKERQQA